MPTGTIGVRMSLVKTVRSRKIPPRRQNSRWSRRSLVKLVWGGFCLEVRYLPFRGWEPIRLVERGFNGLALWPSPALEVEG